MSAAATPASDRTDTAPGRRTLMAAAFVLLWCTGYPAGKIAVQHAAPFTILLLRFSIAGAVFGGLAMRLDATHLQQIAHVEHGAVVPASVWNTADRIDPQTGALLDSTGGMAEQLKGAEIIMRTDPLDPLIPRQHLPYLRANGIKFQWSLPLWQDDEVLGVFTLGFAQHELADSTAELVRLLAQALSATAATPANIKMRNDLRLAIRTGDSESCRREGRASPRQQ